MVGVEGEGAVVEPGDNAWGCWARTLSFRNLTGRLMAGGSKGFRTQPQKPHSEPLL